MGSTSGGRESKLMGRPEAEAWAVSEQKLTFWREIDVSVTSNKSECVQGRGDLAKDVQCLSGQTQDRACHLVTRTAVMTPEMTK